ncbi:MAG: chorismate lyase [Magnetococcales bacterium]|nr:chorismate lyase [Magnetococcales bacterium]
MMETPWQGPQASLADQQSQLSVPLMAALSCTGSLTRQLEKAWQRPVNVRLEQQKRQSGPEESTLFDGYALEQSGPVLIRDAWLTVDGTDRIFAHSQILLSDLPQSIQDPLEAGEIPLGALFLQRNERVRRQQLELARARIPALAERLDVSDRTVFWCRRSLFQVETGVRARILEVFLP